MLVRRAEALRVAASTVKSVVMEQTGNVTTAQKVKARPNTWKSQTQTYHCAKCSLSCDNMGLTCSHWYINSVSLTSTGTRCYSDSVEEPRIQPQYGYHALRRVPDMEHVWSLHHHHTTHLAGWNLARPVDREGGSGDVGRP